MYRVMLLITLLLCSINANAGLFGPSDPRECLIKYHKQVKLEDAKNLLMFACGVGYSGNVNTKAEKIGRCIASEASEFYSFENTLKVINNCTKKSPAFFGVFRDKLYEGVNASIQAGRQRQKNEQFDREQSSSDGPVTLYDSATGTYKYCHKTGGVMSCF